jgi:hypothetical protein
MLEHASVEDLQSMIGVKVEQIDPLLAWRCRQWIGDKFEI